MDIATALILLPVGILAGALNAVAGGATFFTFPALMAVGLPPMTANATNFVALVPGNLAALPAFRVELKAMRTAILPLLFVCGGGGVVGAIALLWFGNSVFEDLVPWLMGFATLLFAVAPALRRRISGRAAGKAVIWPTLFLFSVYGGYFGAGLGQVMLAALILAGYDDFHRANALKNAVVGWISVLAVGIYGLGAAIAWPHALIMMIGATIGGYGGGVVSRRVPQQALRLIVIAFGALLTGYYFMTG